MAERMTRSRARASGLTPQPIHQAAQDDTKSSVLRGRTRSKGAAADVTSTLFSKTVDEEQHEATNQELPGRDQGEQPMAVEAPAAQEEAPPASPVAASPVAASPVAADPATPMMMSPLPAADCDPMAISPAPFTMAEQAATQLSFGTPIDGAMQLMSPSLSQAPAAVETCGTPQLPMQEFSFELSKAAEPAEEQQDVGSEPISVAAPELAASPPPAELSLAAAPQQASTPTMLAKPEGSRTSLRTPKSAAAPGPAVPRPAAKAPLSTLKPAGTRTPLASPAPSIGARRVPVESAKKTPAKDVEAPAPVGIAKSTPKAAEVTKATKRVSIATPQAAKGPVSVHAKLQSTPYPRAGSRTPAALAAEVMDEDLPESLAIEDVAADDVDAAMALAAALPSYRTTAEDAPAVCAVPSLMSELQPLAAALEAAAASCEQQEVACPCDDMDMDMVDASLPAAATPAAAAVSERSFTPEFAPLPAASSRKTHGTPAAALHAKPAATPKSAKYEPAHLQFQALAKPEGHSPAAAASGPKLTFPVSTASYMAGTKASMQKARPLTADDSAAPSVRPSSSVAANRPRVKSVVVGGAGDDKSMKQLKREIKAAMASKPEVKVQGMDSDDEMGEAPYNQADEEMLVAAMGTKIEISTDKRTVLNGQPMPLGTHIRFEEDGEVVPSPTSGKTMLKGMPTPKGRHTHFDY